MDRDVTKLTIQAKVHGMVLMPSQTFTLDHTGARRVFHIKKMLMSNANTATRTFPYIFRFEILLSQTENMDFCFFFVHRAIRKYNI